MQFPFSIVRLLGLTALSVVLLATGCGDSGDPGGDGEHRGVCRSCDGDMPIGPNESQEACDAFGERYGCASVEFSGSCAEPDLANKATCEVDDCTRQPDPDCSVDDD